MPRFLLAPRWILIHIVTLIIVVTCVSLAFWQLGRLDERREVNARVEARTAMEPVALDRLLPSEPSPQQISDAEFRMVAVEGTFDPDAEVILQSRTFNGRPGNHLLTPLVTSGGQAIIVDRGWIPLPSDDEVRARARVVPARVTVTGQLLPGDDRSFLGVSDPPPGRVVAISRVDLQRLGEQMDYRLQPLYLRLQEQEPAATSGLPEPVPLPPQSEGPHQEYMVQWFLFAAIGMAVYGGLVGREVRRNRSAGTADPDAPDAQAPLRVRL